MADHVTPRRELTGDQATNAAPRGLRWVIVEGRLRQGVDLDDRGGLYDLLVPPRGSLDSMAVEAKQRIDFDAYLAAERTASVRHELVDGEVVEVAGRDASIDLPSIGCRLSLAGLYDALLAGSD